MCVNNTRQPPEEWADDNSVNVQLAQGNNDFAVGLEPHQVRMQVLLLEKSLFPVVRVYAFICAQ